MEISGSDLQQFTTIVEKIENEISKNIIGQKEIIRQVLICIFSGGNVLLEGMPGLGKTQLVKTIGKVMSLEFSRIQFTPDLMPADVVGTNVITRGTEGASQFRFEKGPVFSNIVLADEINRATPKTQSALLEAMQEQTVTVGTNTYKLPQPFFVLATQNPIEMEGTYPLPEAQMDRFLFKLNVKFPSLQELYDIVTLTTTHMNTEIKSITNGQDILKMRDIVKQVPIAGPVMEYALKLVMATHPHDSNSPKITHDYVRYGSSPRGAQSIISTARVRALMDGRYNVSFDDIKYVAYPALRHRIFLNFEGMAERIDTDTVISEIIKSLG
ncbi:MAG: MoxR-like ATPase [Clostridia bacterium]|jgi:MoxR-like ATPase|uniref:AAA family ATPase n=1 Tax=Petroclostridium xylanilyticum TaxID=1792311 RepID=UPI000B9816FA|nr:MoxR family ATPase [Petroclostridium xylanilyticum]MBZ4645801.1 MoxR-like ATPase [Clostridia bacterium]